MTEAQRLLSLVQDTTIGGDGFSLILSDGSCLVFIITEEGEVTAHAGIWERIQGSNHEH